MNIVIDNFLPAFGIISAFAVWGLIAFIVFIVFGVITTKIREKEKDKKDKFEMWYQDEKCFGFVYYKDNSYQQVCISKDKLRTLIEDKKIDLLYEEESK